MLMQVVKIVLVVELNKSCCMDMQGMLEIDSKILEFPNVGASKSFIVAGLPGQMKFQITLSLNGDGIGLVKRGNVQSFVFKYLGPCWIIL